MAAAEGTYHEETASIVSPDGTMLAVDSQHQAQSGIRVWEVETGRQLLSGDGSRIRETVKSCTALAFSATSGTLASGDEGGTLVLWDIGTDDVVWRETYPTGIQSIAFSRNGEVVAVALWDTTYQMLQWRKQ